MENAQHRLTSHFDFHATLKARHYSQHHQSPYTLVAIGHFERSHVVKSSRAVRQLECQWWCESFSPHSKRSVLSRCRDQIRKVGCCGFSNPIIGDQSLHRCPCSSASELDKSDPVLEEGGKALVAHLNDILSSRNYSLVCSKLTLKSVINGRRLGIVEQGTAMQVCESTIQAIRCLTSPSRNTLFQTLGFQMTVEVLPSNAVFEAIFQRKEDRVQVVGEVSRINRYGQQADCITDVHVRPMCYCI